MRRTATLVPFVALVALLLGGCVISETEKGPGPGDQKKDASDGERQR